MNYDAALASHQKIIRKKRRQIMVGTVPVGGDAPITVQTMTNTNTADVRAPLNRFLTVLLKVLTSLECLAQIKPPHKV